MTPRPALTRLDDLIVQTEGYANFMMRKNGRVPPTLLAATPKGDICYVPHGLADARAKNDFANTARLSRSIHMNRRRHPRLICAAYAAAAAVMALEAWAAFAKPVEPFDTDTPRPRRSTGGSSSS